MITKTTQVQVKTSAEEKSIFKAAAARRKMEVSEYVRTLVLIDYFSNTSWETFIGLMHKAIISLSKFHK